MCYIWRVSLESVHVQYIWLISINYELYMSVLAPLSFSAPEQENAVFFYKRTHSLQNYQRNSLLRLSYQFVSAIFFGNKTHKRSKDTLHSEPPLSFLVYIMSLFSSTIQDCIYCSHGDFHAWTRLWFLVSIMCSWTIFQLCLCGLMIYKFLTFCTAYFLSHAL